MAESENPLLKTINLVKTYDSEEGFFSRLAGSGRRIPALNGVSLDIAEGEIVGLTGESGSGKSALGKIIAGLEKPDGGKVEFMGKSLTGMSDAEFQKARRFLRYISEDNFSGLTNDPKNRLDNLLYQMADRNPGEGGKAGGRSLANELVEKFGLTLDFLERYPFQISGGQRQRYALARALSSRPKLVVADEPVSNLDLNSRTEILNMTRRLGREFGSAFLFISHNLSMVRYFAAQGRTAIMFGGRIMEILPTSRLYDLPTHPYTRTLLEINPAPTPFPGAVLDPGAAFSETEHYSQDDSSLQTMDAEASDMSLSGNRAAAAQLMAAHQPGCVFYRWCPEHIEKCKEITPSLELVTKKRDGKGDRIALEESEINSRHRAACLHYI
jgi:ABC-type oligopeptide transport system ATPase subunit